MANVKEIPFQIKAVKPTDDISIIKENAINYDKGIAFFSENKLFILQINDNGEITTKEIK